MENESFNELLQLCKLGHVEEVVHKIDSNKSLLAMKTSEGWSLLSNAVCHDHFVLAQELLECGADVNDCNVNGTTILMYAKTPAFKTGDYKLLDLLIHHGADVNALDKRGWTVLDYVLQQGDKKMAAYFMSKGAVSGDRS
jgi:methionyl-tRNA formyltransferase